MKEIRKERRYVSLLQTFRKVEERADCRSLQITKATIDRGFLKIVIEITYNFSKTLNACLKLELALKMSSFPDVYQKFCQPS